jgi:hypothetical protein
MISIVKNPSIFAIFLFIYLFMGARGSVVVKALCCKPKVAGSSPDEVDFLKN